MRHNVKQANEADGRVEKALQVVKGIGLMSAAMALRNGKGMSSGRGEAVMMGCKQRIGGGFGTWGRVEVFIKAGLMAAGPSQTESPRSGWVVWEGCLVDFF